MTERILDISDGPASLAIDLGRLRIRTDSETHHVLPGEIGVVIVSSPGVSYTHAVLDALMEAGAVFICCDARRMPSGMMLPLKANATQTERFARQAVLPLPKKKNLWRQIARAKVLAQAALLFRLHGSDAGLEALARRVTSGDAGNVEGQAARLYWPRLFGDAAFLREPEAEDQNRLLNYGYAVLRGMTARGICGAGLHPSLGLHHHNRYDSFCLASDLMESFRPVVDEAVAGICSVHGRKADLSTEVKRKLLGHLSGRYRVDGEWRRLQDVIHQVCSSLADVVLGERRELSLPGLGERDVGDAP